MLKLNLLERGFGHEKLNHELINRKKFEGKTNQDCVSCAVWCKLDAQYRNYPTLGVSSRYFELCTNLKVYHENICIKHNSLIRSRKLTHNLFYKILDFQQICTRGWLRSNWVNSVSINVTAIKRSVFRYRICFLQCKKCAKV